MIWGVPNKRASQLRDQNAMDILAANVRKYRARSNLSQEALANLSGIELSTVSRIERGVLNSSVSIIFALANAMGVDPKQLLD